MKKEKYQMKKEKNLQKEQDSIFASTSAQKKEDSGIKFLFENMARKILEPDFDFYAEEQKKKKHI